MYAYNGQFKEWFYSQPLISLSNIIWPLSDCFSNVFSISYSYLFAYIYFLLVVWSQWQPGRLPAIDTQEASWSNEPSYCSCLLSRRSNSSNREFPLILIACYLISKGEASYLMEEFHFNLILLVSKFMTIHKGWNLDLLVNWKLCLLAQLSC